MRLEKAATNKNESQRAREGVLQVQESTTGRWRTYYQAVCKTNKGE